MYGIIYPQDLVARSLYTWQSNNCKNKGNAILFPYMSSSANHTLYGWKYQAEYVTFDFERNAAWVVWMLKIKFKDVNFTCENKNCGSEAWHLQHDDVRNAFTQVQHQRALHSNQCDGRHTDQLCCHLGQIPDRTSNTERLCVCVCVICSSRMVVLWVFWRVYSQTDAFQGLKDSSVSGSWCQCRCEMRDVA